MFTFGLGGLGGLFYIVVLIINAIAVLSEDRFLAQIGFTGNQDPGFGGGRDPNSATSKIVNLINSTRTIMRMPLILINTVIIVYEIL